MLPSYYSGEHDCEGEDNSRPMTYDEMAQLRLDICKLPGKL